MEYLRLKRLHPGLELKRPFKLEVLKSSETKMQLDDSQAVRTK
jgi:hypothetical protein